MLNRYSKETKFHKKMNKSSFLVDLRPDRDLLDPSFGGYKLSLDSVPIYKESIPEGVDSIQPNDDQFSFSHVKLFSLQNHLHVNPYTNTMYFIDKKWNVTKVFLNFSNKLEDLQVMWKIPNLELNKKRMYNVSLAFANSETVILSDGAGTAYILSIGINDNVETWTCDFSLAPCENGLGFVLSDSQLLKGETENLLHLIFMHIEQKKDKAKEVINTGFFHTIIEWVTLSQSQGNEWIKKSHKKLEADGNVEHIALEPGCNAIFVVGDKVPKWTFDSEKEIVQEGKDEENGKEQKVLFTWSQGEKELLIRVPLTDDIQKSDIVVNIKPKYLKLKIKETEIMSGGLFNRIDLDLTSWTVEKDKFEMLLMKQVPGPIWPELILNEKRGKQTYDPKLVGKVHEQLAHLCSDKEVDPGQPSFNSQQLEDCDTASCDTVVLVRMSAENHSVMHEVSLSSFQWLFKVGCDPEKVPAICLRHDVDACVWQFQKTEDSDKNWPYKHIGTFFAFGYVQASKNQKKYLTCPPDLSYVVICETSRHIYLYRQPGPISGELRNRSSGEKVETVSMQQLINLDNNEQIVGVYATNSLLYVLTENIIHVLTINE